MIVDIGRRSWIACTAVPLAASVLAGVPVNGFAADPRASPRSLRVVEGDRAMKTVRIAVRLSGRAPAGASVRFRTRAGTAGRRDFAARAGTLRFRRGSRGAVIVLRIRGDRRRERNERFSVRLSSPQRLRLGRVRAASVTILDDDAPVTATLAAVTATEPAAPGAVGSHGLTVALSRAPRTAVRVDFELVGGGTTTAADVDLVRGTLTFAPGERRKTLPGSLRGDALDEVDETATVLLTNPVGLRLANAWAALTIVDDPADVPPSLSIGDASVSEADGTASLPVTLSAPSGRSISVAYATQDGTADGADRPAASGTVTFAPGATGAAIAAPITNDARDEETQSFAVALAQPDGATLADGTGTVTIADDDAPPTVSIDDVSFIEAAGIATFTVSLSAPSEKAVSARAGTVSSTATGGSSCAAGVDYVALSSQPVAFSPGEATRPLEVAICEDASDESTETASVVLTDLANASPGDLSGLLAILDEDP
jgi:chitinase